MFIKKTSCGKDVIFDSESSCPKRKLNLNSSGYARYTELVKSKPKKQYKTVLVHRLICKAVEGEVVDHINGNKLDNRLSNLRRTTQSLNIINRTKTNGVSKYIGVCSVLKNKFTCEIKLSGVRYRMGWFDNEEDAARMRDYIVLCIIPDGYSVKMNFDDSKCKDYKKNAIDRIEKIIHKKRHNRKTLEDLLEKIKGSLYVK